MSRIGKVPIRLPKEVKAALQNGLITIEGPKGKTSMNLPIGIQVEQKEDKLVITRKNDVKQSRANHGTIRAILSHMVVGVTVGHKKELEIQGIGFRAQVQGSKLALNLGFSHPVEFVPPQGIKVSTPTQTSIVVEGIDKALVGEVAAKIRDFKRPEPYKGKGIRYVGEIVRRKQGKSVTK